MESADALSGKRAEFEPVAAFQVAALAVRLRLLAVESTLPGPAVRGGEWHRRAGEISRRAPAPCGTLRRLKVPRGQATEVLMARMIVVDRDGKEHEIEAKTGLKIMEILRELDYGVAAICGGLCSCATCHIYVDEGWATRLPKPQSDELELLRELPDFRDATSRLSCQVDFTEALSGLKVAIAPDT